MKTRKKRTEYRLEQSAFYRLPSPRKLAQVLQLTEAEMQKLVEAGDKLYREFDISTKNGGKRRVEEPIPILKRVHRQIARLLSRIQAPDYLFCPVKRRSYVTNAARHQGNRVVRCLDVKTYFPSTLSRRVFWFFRTIMQCPADVAAILAKLSCYQGHLPTGSPLSPIMSYYAHYDVWGSVAAIAATHGCVLTVYMDDVTLSGEHVRESVLWNVKQAIYKSGLRYHKEKTFIDRPAEITGVIVEATTLRAPTRQHKKLREARIELRRPGNSGSRVLNGRVVGLQGQIKQIADQTDKRSH